jgi:hypothetical protein
LPHVFLQLCVAARIARGTDLLEEPGRRQLGKLVQPRVDDAAKAIDLACHGRARRVAHRRVIELAIKLARFDPVIHGSPRNAKLARNLRPAQATLQIVT